MADWLYSWPDWLLLVTWAGSFALQIVAMPSLTQRLPGLRPGPDSTDFVLRLQPTLFTVTSFVVAFTLFEAQSNIRKIDALVSSEAAQINRLDRLLVRYDDGLANQARGQLLTYARSVIAEDWPDMLSGGVMDHPLKGRSAVDPAAIVQTIALIEGRKG